MNYSYEKVKNWMTSKDYCLPGVSNLTQEIGSEVLIIGAAVFELYELQGWITKLQRKTGDIDLSVGLVGDDSTYNNGKAFLAKMNYKVDEVHPYRFHPAKKIPGGYAYIDLLAHPQSPSILASIAQNAMGVGPGFSMENFAFARTNAYALEGGTIFPNPFGFISLKMASYLDEPLKRIKDFADIVELINGLVVTGTHFELEELWNVVKDKEESKKIKDAIAMMKSSEAIGNWELEAVQEELVKRNFESDFIETTLRQRISDFYDQLT